MLVVVAVSQPLAADPSQSPKPAVHVSPQREPAHVGVALSAPGQRVPQAPQLFGSIAKGASQPLVPSASQSP